MLEIYWKQSDEVMPLKNINIHISTLGKDLQSYVVFANET